MLNNALFGTYVKYFNIISFVIFFITQGLFISLFCSIFFFFGTWDLKEGKESREMSTKKDIEFFFFKIFIKIITDLCIFLDQIIVIYSKNKCI